MANLWVDGFEGYDSFGLTQGYMLEGGGEHTETGGRGGGRLLSGGASRVFLGPLDHPAGRTLISGAARQNGENIAWLSTANQALCRVSTNGFGQVVVQAWNGAVLQTLTPPMRLLNAWRYWEHKIKIIDATHISYELRVDELTLIPMVTYTTPSNAATMIELIDFEAATVGDDWYVNDDTGSAPDNDYWGDTRMIAIGPISDSSVTWTPDSGATNYNRVNETATDYDTSYVQTSVVNNQDLYNYAPTGLPGGTTIRTVAVMTSAKRLSDAGPRQMKTVLKSGSTTVQGPLHQLSDTYYMVQFRNPLDPNTGAGWNASAVDALKAGQILIA